jgi:hypothetical protein
VRIKTTVQESQQNKIEKNNDRSGRIVKKKKKPTTNLGDFIKKTLQTKFLLFIQLFLKLIKF